MGYADKLLDKLLAEEQEPRPAKVAAPVSLPKPIKFKPPEEKKPKPEKKKFVPIQAGWKTVQPHNKADLRPTEEFGYVVKKVPPNRRIHCGFCKRLLEAGAPVLFYDSKLEQQQYWWCQPTCTRIAKDIVTVCPDERHTNG
jgi:hypothetical protein